MRTVLGIGGVALALCLMALVIASILERQAQRDLETYRDYLVCAEAGRFDDSVLCLTHYP